MTFRSCHGDRSHHPSAQHPLCKGEGLPKKGQISSWWQAKKSYLPLTWLDSIFMTRLWDQDILKEKNKVVIITYLQSIPTVHRSRSVCSTTSRNSFDSSDRMKHYDSRKIPTPCCRIHSEKRKLYELCTIGRCSVNQISFVTEHFPLQYFLQRSYYLWWL